MSWNMVRRHMLIAAVSAAILCGCSREASRAGGGQAPDHERRVVLQLGRPICGDCCVEQVQRAFLGLPGIEGVSMNPGDVDFVVRLNEDGPAADDLVAALVSAGVRGARVNPRGDSAALEKVWVTAR